MKEFINWIISPKIIISAILIIAVIIACVLIKRFGKRYRKGKNEKTILTALNILRVFITFAAILVILQINDINITSLVAGLGIVSAIVGLALQDLLKDIIMGIYIKSESFYNIGECVEYQGRECTVIGFTLISTKLGDIDDHSVFTICNRNISEIRRFGQRMDIDVPLSYDEDAKKVHNMLNNICTDIESIDGVKRCEYKGTQAFESSNILYRLRVHCDPNKRSDVRRSILMLLQDTLAQNDIHIPFNQLDVHLDNK